MNKQDPVFRCKKDEDACVAIQRARLDIFWAQEPSTVASNFSLLRLDYLDSTTMFSLGEDVLPCLPSPALVDRVVMIHAIMTSGATLRQGGYCQNVYVENVHNTSAWYGNARDTMAVYLGTSLGNGKSFSSTSPNSGEWYRR